MIDAARRQRIEDLCEAALDQEASARSAFLATACKDNDELRREVEKLLIHAEAAEGFLVTPITAVAAEIFDDQAPSSLVDRQIGAHRISSLLGSGGMGEVYRARDTRLGRDVAFKVVPDRFLAIPGRLERFDLEAHVLATLNHPHIAAIYGLEEADGVRGLVLELVEGPTLAEHLVSGALSIQESLELARQIADALEAAHEKGIIHRDLKPSNIKITAAGTIKVLDFGLAKVFATDELGSDTPLLAPDQTREGVIAGTTAYMSPEQSRGKPVDKRTDIWSFGCVLYEMLTGRPPFGGETSSDAVAAILEHQPDWSALPGQTPPCIRTLIQRCLEKDPRRRLRDIGDARFEIEEALDPASSHREKTVARPARAGWWKASAVAGLLAVSASAITWQVQRSESERKSAEDRYSWWNPLEGAKPVTLTDFGGAEHHAAISRDGKFVVFLSDRSGSWDAWVSQVGTGKVYNLTKGSGRELRNPATRTVGFSPDGSFVALWSRMPDQGSVDAGWSVPTLGGPIQPYLKGVSELDWSPDADGSRIVYHPPLEGDPLFVTAPNEKVGRQIYVARRGFHNHFPVWSPDGAFIYFVHGLLLARSDIWRIRPDGGEPERLTFHDGRVTFPTFLDNRTLLYLATDRDGSGPWIYSLDITRSISRRISMGLEQYMSLSSSKDGRRLVATISRPTDRVWRVPFGDRVADESRATPISLPTRGGLSPRVGPDYVIYRAPRTGRDGLWKLGADGAVELWSGVNGRAVAGPAIAPDGQRLAFTVQSDERTQLYVMNADGTGTHRVAGDLDVSGAPAWSPDGQWLAIAAYQNGEPQLFRIPLEGGTPVSLVREYSTDPTWSPSGKFLVYSGADVGTVFTVKAVEADGTPHPLPSLVLTRGARRLVFSGENTLIFLKGDISHKEFWAIDLRTGRERQLTSLGRRFVIGDFDLSRDGREIVFDRTREESDIVLFDLPRR
jgi:serine/threonine protein kinase/Tol biopolymer transport system component